MKRLLAAGCLVLLAPTAVWASTWRPVIDTYGSSRAQFVYRDLEQCRQLALQAGGDRVGEGARGAVRGGLVGAAGGAALGAALGNAGRGAAIGAVAGGVTRGVSRSSQSEAQFRQAYANCMRQRGHRVLN
jgi:outer membrane lipoprotein SlyB